jgi:hypothetical protein
VSERSNRTLETSAARMHDFEQRWLAECRTKNRALRRLNHMRMVWPELVECPCCKRMHKLVRRDGGLMAAHRARFEGRTVRCRGSGMCPERRLPEPLDLSVIAAILEDKEVPLSPNEFIDTCRDLVATPTSLTSHAVQPLVDWYMKREGNSGGGALARVLSDGNWEDSFVHGAYEWARESGDWLGVALANAIGRMPMTSRKMIKIAVASKRR